MVSEVGDGGHTTVRDALKLEEEEEKGRSWGNGRRAIKLRPCRKAMGNSFEAIAGVFLLSQTQGSGVSIREESLPQSAGTRCQSLRLA
jgi:hypothetical protein